MPLHDCRDYDAEKKQWGWARAAPISQKLGGDPSSSPKKARRKVCRSADPKGGSPKESSTCPSDTEGLHVGMQSLVSVDGNAGK